jgi:diguanylate cyclase (GGDEF)-like protein
LQQGKAYFSTNQSSLPCQHLHLPGTEYGCIPMMVHGETLGVLYLSSPQAEQLTEAQQLLAVTVTENVALALANLKLRETLQYQSVRDPLTGLFNRRYMEEFLNQEIHRAQQEQHSLGIIMVDVDRFKDFNDAFGHEAGDRILRELALCLQRQLRGLDIACRYGGDELLLILPETSLKGTWQRAEKLRAEVKNLKVWHRQQFLGAIALSLGVACFPEHGLKSEAVLRAADAALLRAKKEGRDRTIAAS